MSNLNLRLYADQFYGLYIPKLNNYLTKSIDKDFFITSFKSGILNCNDISTKSEINFSPNLILQFIKINSLNIEIPDENRNLIINVNNLKIQLLLQEISEKDILELIIKDKKLLKEKFIENIFNKITNNSSKNNFLGGIIVESIANKILNGFNLIIKNLELILQFNNFEFIVSIDNIEINHKEIISNLIFKKVNFYLMDIANNEKTNFLNISDINISIDFKENNDNNRNNYLTKAKVEINNFIIILDVKIINSLFDMINIFLNTKQKKFDLLVKKLIYFHRPKIKDKNYYKLLWLYAIKSVIKLRKLYCFGKKENLEISNFAQYKLLQKAESENIIFVNNISLLKSTRKIIEKKILDSKNSFANKFFSFFSSNNDNSKSLTDEEKTSIENYFKEENIIKYLNGELFPNGNKDNQNIIRKKYQKYFNCFNGNIEIINFELNFASKLDLKDKDLYLDKIMLGFEYGNNNLKFQFNIIENANQNIYNEVQNSRINKDIINKNENTEKSIISCNYDNQGKIKILIEKENIQLSENNLILISCYSKFILEKFQEENNIYNYNIEKTREKNDIKFENIINKIYFPFFPSISLKTNNENLIAFKISNYEYNEKLISFKIEINDSKSSILESYQFKINLSNNGVDIDLENPLSININKSIIEELINNFKNIYNEIYLSTKHNDELLFNFNFTKYSNNIELLFNNNININIKEFNFIINDNDNKSSFKLKDSKLILENKNLSLTFNEILSELDILSFIPIIKDIKNINFNYKPKQRIHYEYNMNNIIKSFKMNIKRIEFYLYLSHKSSYIYSIINNITTHNSSQSIYIINNSINEIVAKYIDINNQNDTILLDSKKIDLNIRIISFDCFAYQVDIESFIFGVSTIIYNYEEFEKLSELFLEDNNIIEINIKNLKFEYLKKTDDSSLSIFITNYLKKAENYDIDILNLEKYNLTYNLDCYEDYFVKINSKKLSGEITQRDISLLFFSIISSSQNMVKEENNYNSINRLILDIDLNNISLDFNLRDEYQKPLFNLFFRNISIKADIYKQNINNLNFSTYQLKINYYENNNVNNFIFENKKNLAILDYENENLDEQKVLPQIEIRKNIENKYIINITKINFIFSIDIIISIYNYFKDISIIEFLKNNIENSAMKENKKENIDIQIIISQIQLKFPRNRSYLNFDINKFDFNYVKERKGNIKEYQIKLSLNNIFANYLTRKILLTKNELLLFILDIKESETVTLICNSLLNKIIINLSDLDLIFFDKIMKDILNLIKYFRNEKNIASKETRNLVEQSKEEKLKNYKFLNFSGIKSILSEVNIEGFDITLLEEDENYIDSKLNYKYFYPFFNICFNNSYLKYEFNKNKIDSYPDIYFNSHYDLLLNYFNYNFKIWEPLTEDLTINLNYEYIIESNKILDNYTLEINKFNINSSENFINILLIKILRFYNKFKTRNSLINNESKITEEIILKYKIANFTNIDFDLYYRNKNYKLNKSEQIYLNFGDEEIIENNLNNYIILTSENTEKKVLFFPENIGIKKYRLIINKIEREIYIETKIRFHKHIDIAIYDSIIIKNKTNYFFKISFNETKEDKSKLNLESHSTINIPDNININSYIILYLDSDNNINEDMISINMNEIIPDSINKKKSKEILFKHKNIFFSLVSKIKPDNLIYLTILYKYSIINCLPCSLYISKDIKQKNNNDNIEIAQNSLFNIDNASIFTQSNSIFLKIKIQDQYYSSKLSLMRNETKTKLINFVNSTNDKQFTLQIIIKETYKNKAMIIYSEKIIYNNSGIDLNIYTQDENNNNYIFDIGKNLYLISSEIKNSNSFICIKSSKNIFITNYLKYEDIQKKTISSFTLNFEGKKSLFNFELIIDNNISNLYCENDLNNFLYKINEKNENKITIYTIVPKYNILNLSKNTDNNNLNLVLKNNQKYFLGINIRTIEEIKDKNNYYIFENLSSNSSYTVCFKGRIYTIEIMKSENGGYKNIFIFDNNSNNSQIIVENKTHNEIILKQKSFEKFKQIIRSYEKQILKIYDQNNKNFSVEIDNKLYFFNLNEEGQNQLKNNLFINIEKDKISTKILFCTKMSIKNAIPKTKSMNNLIQSDIDNLKSNFNKDQYTKINLLINHINISIISQNKIERKEMFLIFINDFQCGIKLLTSKSHSKYKVKLNTKISNLEIYNLLDNNNSCLFINTTSPLINIYSELIYELKKNRITIYELVNELGKVKLNITSSFLQEIYNVVKSIYEHKDIYSKKIDKIFLNKNIDNLNSYNLKTNYNYNYHQFPLSLVIKKITISGAKIVFKLKKEGIETLPNEILNAINYFKYFPFFDIGKETKAIISKIELQGSYNDIKSLYEEIKMNIIAQLSKEIVIKVLHPSNNDIKENMKNMIGIDISKSNNKINTENRSRIKYKRLFIGKNKFFKKYNKNFSIVEQNMKNLEKFNDKFYIDSFYNFNDDKNIMVFFEDCFVHTNENGQNMKIIYYRNLKDVKKEKKNKKYYIDFNCTLDDNDKSKLHVWIEFKNELFYENIFKILYNFSNL